ncbi:peptide methionine sulfoxide reductase, partial [Rhizobium sp. KAs_5_22]
TDHAETIHIQYDSKQISLQEILKHYFRIVDPTSLNKQGNDVGRQYRTGIYFVEKNDLTVIEQELKTLEPQINQSVVIELEPLKNYV